MTPFGFGVVFSDATLDKAARGRPGDTPRHLASFRHWEDIDIHYRGEVVVSGGHGMCGIHRRRLLDILQQRAQGLGVAIDTRPTYRRQPLSPRRPGGGADGINSAIRSRYATHSTRSELGKCRHMWFGADRSYDALSRPSSAPSTAGSRRTSIRTKTP